MIGASTARLYRLRCCERYSLPNFDHYCTVCGMPYRLRSREPITNFAGGRLPRYRVLDGPTRLDPLHWEYLGRAEFVPLRAGLALQKNLGVDLSTRAGDIVAYAEIGVVDGRPACVAIHAIPPHELTMQVLRNLAEIGQTIRRAVRRNAVRVTRVNGKLVAEEHVDAGEYTGPMGRIEIEADVDSLIEAAAPRRRQTIDIEFLREVTSVYREAVAKSEPTQRAVQRRWATSASNARRWISMARDLGRKTGDPTLLGEALGPLKAGEQQTPKRRRRER